MSRLFSRIIGVLPVDPDRAVETSLALARQALARGDALVWFPEGQRTTTGEIQPLMPGIGALLAAVDVPVVPVHIAGTFRAAPIGRIIPRLVPLRIRFGERHGAAGLVAAGRGATEPERIVDALWRALVALANSNDAERIR